jgi:hypothetical protein
MFWFSNHPVNRNIRIDVWKDIQTFLEFLLDFLYKEFQLLKKEYKRKLMLDFITFYSCKFFDIIYALSTEDIYCMYFDK